MQWIESSIPILHTSHPSTGKCSGSKKNWHQTRNHPFTFTSITWNLHRRLELKESRVQAELSWECKTPFFRPSCSTFLATAASDFWPQLLLQQIFDPAARMWRSPRCTFWTTSRATFQYEEKKIHLLMSFQAKVQMKSDSYWLATGMGKHSNDHGYAIKWLCNLVPFTSIHQH